jgi:prepilin-type N-terminal cleavage/methylation domain-containing protein
MLERLRRRASDQRGMTLTELLVGLIVTAILSVMVLGAWFALSRSYSFSLSSSNAREDGRQTISRMAREIRDAQAPTGSNEAAIVRARSRWILFTTTFNEAGNTDPSLQPHLVMYRLYSDGELWRFEDRDAYGTPGNGVISGVDISVTETAGNSFDVDEQVNGEGATMLCRNLINDSVKTGGNPTPVFRYSRYQSTGAIDVASTVMGTDLRSRIVAVEIRLIVDLNPAHSPVYADLITTAQIRNQH